MKYNVVKDVFYTAVTQFIITVLGILLLKLIAHQVDEENLGVYLIIRRFIGLAFPILTLNLGISLSRYISFNYKAAEQYLFVSVSIITGFIIVLFILYPVYKNILTRLLFGDQAYQLLLTPTLLFLYSNSILLVLCDYFRGKYLFIHMNVTNIAFSVIGLLSAIAFYIPIEGLVAIRYYYFANTAMVLLFCYLILKSDRKKKMSSLSFEKISKAIKSFDKTIIKYGFYRVPNGFFIMGIFTVPLLVASNYFSLKITAYIGIIITILRMIQLSVVPLNTIFLPLFARKKSENDEVVIHKNSQMVLEFIFTLPFFISIVLYYIAPELIQLWFGEKYNIIIVPLRLTSFSVGFLLAYVTIRGILDGLYQKPYNNYIAFFGFFMELVIIFIAVKYNLSLWGLSIALTVSVFLLGCISIIILTKKENLQLINKNILLSLGVNGALGLLFYFFDRIFSFQIWNDVIIKSIVIIISISILFIFYIKMKFNWLEEIKRRLAF